MTAVPPEIGEHLVCSRCRARLRPSGHTYRCGGEQCDAVYPVRDGIPHLLRVDASPFSALEGGPGAPPTAEEPRGLGRVRRTLSGLLPSMTASPSAHRTKARFHALLLQRGEHPAFLVISGRVLGRGSEALIEDPAVVSLETDVIEGPRTQMLCDAHDLPFEDATFDGVLIQAVLEHVLDPVRCVEEIHRVLKPGGRVYSDTPFIEQVHGAPYDFTRFTPLEHRRLFRWFDEVEGGVSVGPGSALAWTWAYFLRSFSDRPPIRRVLNALGRLTGFWLRYFDYVLQNRAGSLDAAGGHYFIGTRRDAPVSDHDIVAEYRGGFAT